MSFSVNVLTHPYSQQLLTSHKFSQIVKVQKTNSIMTTHRFIETIVIVTTQLDMYMAQNSIKKIQNTITHIHHMARHQTCE